MSKLKKSEMTVSKTLTTPEEEQLAKARSRKSQASPSTKLESERETAITPAHPTAVTQPSEVGQEEELNAQSVQPKEYVQNDMEAARRLGVQLALAERQNDEVAFSAYQQTKELIEEELGAAPQIFRRYSEIESIDLNGIATEQFDAAGLKFSANANLSALAERLLNPQDAGANAGANSSQNSMA